MTQPTPEPVPTQSADAEDENPAADGADTHFGEEQAGLANDNVSPTQDASKDEESDKLYDTDKNS